MVSEHSTFIFIVLEQVEYGPPNDLPKAITAKDAEPQGTTAVLLIFLHVLHPTLAVADDFDLYENGIPLPLSEWSTLVPLLVETLGRGYG